jgi:hypothetical protein
MTATRMMAPPINDKPLGTSPTATDQRHFRHRNAAGAGGDQDILKSKLHHPQRHRQGQIVWADRELPGR